MLNFFFWIIKEIKLIFVIVIGFTILLIGLALLILPGPGLLIIIIGLLILATEFVWAKRMLKRAQFEYQKAEKIFKQKARQLTRKDV